MAKLRRFIQFYFCVVQNKMDENYASAHNICCRIIFVLPKVCMYLFHLNLLIVDFVCWLKCQNSHLFSHSSWFKFSSIFCYNWMAASKSRSTQHQEKAIAHTHPNQRHENNARHHFQSQPFNCSIHLLVVYTHLLQLITLIVILNMAESTCLWFVFCELRRNGTDMQTEKKSKSKYAVFNIFNI